MTDRKFIKIFGKCTSLEIVVFSGDMYKLNFGEKKSLRGLRKLLDSLFISTISWVEGRMRPLHIVLTQPRQRAKSNILDLAGLYLNVGQVEHVNLK